VKSSSVFRSGNSSPNEAESNIFAHHGTGAATFTKESPLRPSQQEIDRRVGEIRKEMSEEGLDALIVFSSVLLGHKGACRYLSNYRLMTRKQYVVLPLAADPTLIVPTLGQEARAKEESWIEDVRSGGETEGMIKEIAVVLRSSGTEKGRVGVVNLKTSLPFYDYQCMIEALPKASFSDSTALLDRVRAVKSPEELEMVKETTELADRCYERLVEILRPGTDEVDIMATVEGLLAREGAEDTLILTAKGQSFPCFIGPPGPYRFAGGDHYVFSVELSGPSGYWSQIVRPLSLGSPSSSYGEMFAIGQDVLERAVSRLIPGNRVGDIVGKLVSEVEKAGYRTGLWCGHGMGTDLGDGIDFFRHNPLELKAGMIITLHPHVLSRDGREGLLIGDTYVVGEDGGKNLSRTTCEMRFV
jgi:Xaa-Pro dipeptidase